MISVEEAKNRTYTAVKKNTTVVKSVSKSLNHYLSQDVFSPINMPPFRQSAMDGYALRYHESDIYKLIDEVKAGDGHQPKLQAGEAVRIFTGAAVPDDADVVIMQEKVTTVSSSQIKIEKKVTLQENIRPLGEQVQHGALALPQGTKLTAAAIGYLATLGISEVLVYQKPSIAIVATGNELVEVGQPLAFGQIYESNTIMLQTALLTSGFDTISVYKVADNYQATKDLLAKIIAEKDVVLISGGISVGDYDFVGQALQELHVQEIFYKVKQKPGKPLFFGLHQQKPVFALPGNPAAALTGLYVYILPVLQKMIGNTDYKTQLVDMESASHFTKSGDRAQFLKAFFKENKVTLLEGQSSAMLQTFAVANALVYIPEDVFEIKTGDTVEVLILPT